MVGHDLHCCSAGGSALHCPGEVPRRQCTGLDRAGERVQILRARSCGGRRLPRLPDTVASRRTGASNLESRHATRGQWSALRGDSGTGGIVWRHPATQRRLRGRTVGTVAAQTPAAMSHREIAAQRSRQRCTSGASLFSRTDVRLLPGESRPPGPLSPVTFRRRMNMWPGGRHSMDIQPAGSRLTSGASIIETAASATFVAC